MLFLFIYWLFFFISTVALLGCLARRGDRCPVGSHIRRTNPRDGLMPNTEDSLLVADRHRLLRRGRAYGPPVAASFDPADILLNDDEDD